MLAHVSVPELYRVVISAPTSPNQKRSTEWQGQSLCFQCLNEADKRQKSVREQRDLEVVADYFFVEYPELSEKTRSVHQHSEERARREAGFVLLVMRALACTVEVFLHKSSTFGERYLGPQVAVALLILFFLPAFVPHENPEPVWYFACAFFVGCAMVQAGTAKRRKRGELGPHSFYSGTPILLGRSKETTVKRVIEPVVVWIASAIAHEFSPLLSGYLAIAGVALLLSVNLTVMGERKRMMDMHDAYMEQRRVAEEWRSMHRE